MIPHSARSIARRAALTTAAIIGAVVLAGGTATAAPTGATAETSSVGVAAACGLTGEMKKHPVPGWDWYYYNIRNCHSFTVWRYVNVTNSVSRDGRCHYIPAGGTVSSRLEMYTQFDTVLGLKAC
jgi:hypothetical protein